MPSTFTESDEEEEERATKKGGGRSSSSEDENEEDDDDDDMSESNLEENDQPSSMPSPADEEEEEEKETKNDNEAGSVKATPIKEDAKNKNTTDNNNDDTPATTATTTNNDNTTKEEEEPPPKPKKSPSKKAQKFTWNDRAAAVFLFLHPSIYGKTTENIKARYAKTSKVSGCNPNTLRQWVSLHDKGAEQFIANWYPLVSDLTWKKVKERYEEDWVEKFDLPRDLEDDADVKGQLGPYEAVASKVEIMNMAEAAATGMVIGGGGDDPTTPAPPSDFKLDENGRPIKKKRRCARNIHIAGGKITKIKRLERGDRGKARKFAAQVDAIESYVKSKWDAGMPAKRSEVYEHLKSLDIGREGTPFYSTYFVKAKQPALSMFINRCLDRIDYTERKKTIIKKLPKKWKSVALENVKEIRKIFQEKEVDVVVSADDMYVSYFPEMEYGFTSRGANFVKPVDFEKRKGTKKRFTVMVASELNGSTLLDPFCILDGAKQAEEEEDSTEEETSECQKFRNWREKEFENTAKITFHPNHQFDQDIFIEFLEYLVSLYPKRKIGLIWDSNKECNNEKVKKYIEQNKDRLTVACIEPGLKNIIEVGNLCAKRHLKLHIKSSYEKWRASLIRAQRAAQAAAATAASSSSRPEPPRFKIQLSTETMIRFVEESFQTFNKEQRKTETIREHFGRVNLNPWKEDGSEAFKEHLERLKELDVYKDVYDNHVDADLALCEKVDISIV